MISEAGHPPTWSAVSLGSTFRKFSVIASSLPSYLPAYYHPAYYLSAFLPACYLPANCLSASSPSKFSPDRFSRGEFSPYKMSLWLRLGVLSDCPVVRAAATGMQARSVCKWAIHVPLPCRQSRRWHECSVSVYWFFIFYLFFPLL